MRTVKWNAFLSGLCGFAVALGAMAATASADVTTERGASILVFPKVISDGTFDTVIQITNTSNDVVFARCFYVNGQLADPSQPEHPVLNPPLCTETDFNIRLTRQQPTHWLVSRGRPVNPSDACNPGSTPTCISQNTYGVDANGTGIDPGAVPPVGNNFRGELKCVEVDATGAPLGGNHLKGEATIKGAPQGAPQGNAVDVSKYNALGIRGTELAGAAGNALFLNNAPGVHGGMYDACPERLIVNHFAEDVEDPVAGEGSAVLTYITFVPCSEDFENQLPATVTLQFKVINEFETPFSTSTSITCWKDIRLKDIGNTNIFDASVLGSTVASSHITPADIKDGGVLAVLEEWRRDSGGNVARSAVNVHTVGNRFFGDNGTEFDRIILPGQF